MKLKSEQESYRNAQAGAQPVRESYEAPMPGAKMPASVSPNVQDMPLVFDKPRRHFGCGLWFLILIFITVIGGVVSWQLMEKPERERLKTQFTEMVRETPLDFLRNWLMPRLDVKPPIPPINASGDGGVMPERDKTRAEQQKVELPASTVQGTIAPTSNDPAQGVQDPENALPGEEKTAPAPVKEDERVRPAFVNDLASWIVNRYNPQSRGGNLGVSVQSLNQRYGSNLTGLAVPRGGAAGRASILRYAFTPSMVHAIYNIYADELLRSVAAEASAKKLNEAQTKNLYRALGSRCTLLAGGLESVASIEDLPGRMNDLARKEEAITLANRASLDARFDLEQARDQGGNVRAAQASVNAAARNLQSAMAAHAAAERRLAEDIRRKGAGALSQESILYLAGWVNRRLAENPSALAGVQASAEVLRDLAARCARASREGAPAAPGTTSAPQTAAPANAQGSNR